MLQEEMEDLGHEDLLAGHAQDRGERASPLGLINDVLDLSKIEAEGMETYVEDFHG